MKRTGRLIAPLAWMALLWALSSIPATAEHPGAFGTPPWLQNALHIPAFAVLCVAWLWAFDSGGSLGAPGVLALCATVAYGIIDEVHQAFVPGRYAAADDVTLDTVGGTLALLYIAAFRTKAAT